MVDGKTRLARIVADSSQASVAARVGVSQQAVSSWVRGLARPDDVARHKLLAIFGIPVESWRTAAERKALREVQTPDPPDELAPVTVDAGEG